MPAPMKESVFPSFEFVKYKYFFGRRTPEDSARYPQDFSTLSWVISATPLVALLFLMNLYVLAILSKAGFGLLADERWQWMRLDLFAWVTVAAFAGAVLSMLRSLFRAINNFDLSPASFIGAMINLISGITLAQIFYFGLFLLPGSFFPPNAEQPTVMA